MISRRNFFRRRSVGNKRHAAVIAACFALSALLGLTWALFPLAIVDIEQSFGWSRFESSAAFSLFMLGHALSTPVLSRALGSGVSRAMLLGLAVLLSTGMIGAGMTGNPWVFYALFGLVAGAGTQAFGSYVLFSAISQLGGRNTATVMAFVDSGAGIGLFVGLPILNLLLQAWGWRGTFIGLGLVLGLIGVILHTYIIPYIHVSQHASTDIRKAAGTKVVLLLAVSTMLGALAFQGIQSQHFAAFSAFGFEDGRAVYAVSLSGLLMMAWRLASGIGADRWSAPRVMILAAAGAAVLFLSIIAMAASTSTIWLLLYALGLAVGFGAQGIIIAATLHARPEAGPFPTQFSLIRTAAGVGLVLGPVTSGWIVQFDGGYVLLAAVLSVLTLMHLTTYWLAVKNSLLIGL